MSKLVLASASPRRKQLFGLITADFAVRTAEVDESVCAGLPAPEQCLALAELKANAVFSFRPECTVIGCDTVVALDKKVYGKPADRAEAQSMLRDFSNRRHTVYTGVCIVSQKQRKSFVCETGVDFYALSETEIAAYTDTAEPYDKAGGYGIQGKGALFVRGISGDYYNVMGLPASKLWHELRAMGEL